MQPWASFYRGKRVLVTGHTGFKGCWLSLWLLELGAQVHGYSLPAPTEPSLFGESKLADRLHSHEIGDVCDHEHLHRTVAKVRPEIVFHMAAQSLVRRSYMEPRQTYETNIMGTVNLLETVRRVPGVRVCQVITSDKCYENRADNHPCKEGDAMGGVDPYSSSKGCAELVVAAYRHSFFPPGRLDGHGVSLSSARAGNVIGGGDWAQDRILPDCIRALEKNQPIIVRNPDAVRPWQHVLEPLSGYLALAARQWCDPAAFAEGWNFGPVAAGHVKVRQIVEKTISVWGGGAWKTSAAANHLHEAEFLQLDISKAINRLGWKPLLSVDEAVEQTVMWYRQRADAKSAFDAHKLALKQIRSYMARNAGSNGTSTSATVAAQA